MSPTLVAISAFVIAASAAGAYLFLRARQPKAEKTYHFRCPTCEQKLRYAESRAGRPAMCTRCTWRGLLPLKPQIVDNPRTLAFREAERRATALRA
jgi:DNA-directed RNA polymerase subunit RPC12/RpoP